MKRIKYRLTDKEGVWESSVCVENKRGVLYDVILDENDMTYKVVDFINNNVYKSIKPSKNFRMLKINVKKRLEELGCEFEYEVRNR